MGDHISRLGRQTDETQLRRYRALLLGGVGEELVHDGTYAGLVQQLDGRTLVAILVSSKGEDPVLQTPSIFYLTEAGYNTHQQASHARNLRYYAVDTASW